MSRRIDLTGQWREALAQEFEQPYMQGLRDFLQREKQQGKVIYPPGSQMFNALKHTDFADVKVVILGQDPYHGPGQAHGLSFSVPDGVKPPPSLMNIFKELASDLGLPQPHSGNLTPWAQQGVLLLNATLSVEAHLAGSHQGKGWETFTDRVIQALNEGRDQLVFMLWGSYAQRKGALIDRQRHAVLLAPHPSPLSCHRGFFGCKHFSQANAYLTRTGQTPIDWRLP